MVQEKARHAVEIAKIISKRREREKAQHVVQTAKVISKRREQEKAQHAVETAEVGEVGGIREYLTRSRERQTKAGKVEKAEEERSRRSTQTANGRDAKLQQMRTRQHERLAA